MRFNKVSIVLMTLLTVLLLKENALATNVPIYHNIPAYQEKDFFETEKVKISGIKVETFTDSGVTTLEKSVKFEVYNSTKQKTECEVISEGGMLPEINLVKNHNYIIFAQDSEYTMENVYAWVRGNTLVNIKEIGDANNPTYDYPEVTSLQLQKRETSVDNPEEDKRVFVNLPVKYGEATIYNTKICLISEVETIETTSGDRGYLRVSLLEDVPYMLQVEHNEYGIEAFPLVVKDKSEYGAGKYTYDFSSCKRVESIQLVKKADVHNNDTIVSGLYGRATIGGMNFKDMLLIDKKLDVKLDERLNGKDYEVLSMALVNPHRWEIGKLPVGNFKITLSEKDNREIKAVYILDNVGNLKEVSFDSVNQTVSFTMDSISICPVVVELGEQKVETSVQPEQPTQPEAPKQPVQPANPVKIDLKAPASAKAQLSGGYDDVKFSWSKVKDASGYYVYYKKSNAKKYTSLGSTTKLSCTKKNLADGVKYQFKVVPYYLKNGKKVQGKYEKTATIYTLKKLGTPKVSKVNKKKIKISWKNISGESGYQISQSTKKKGTKIVSTYSTTKGKAKTLSVKRKKTYYYKVRAYTTVEGKKVYGPWSKVKSYKLK